jgi:hypothetical protein
MNIRTAFLAATIATLPVLAMAQTAAPVTQPPAATSATPDSATQAKPHREHGDHHKRHAEMKAKYEKLSATDKAKVDDLTKQMKQLHQQKMQILGISKS